MISDRTECSTAELMGVVGLSRGRLSQLESAGIIKRVRKDRWRLAATVRALLNDAHQRSDKASATRQRLDELRVEKEQLRIQREAHTLCRTEEFDEGWDLAWGFVVARLVELPARCHRDVQLRQVVERQIDTLRDECSAWFLKQSESLHRTGKAADVSGAWQ